MYKNLDIDDPFGDRFMKRRVKKSKLPSKPRGRRSVDPGNDKAFEVTTEDVRKSNAKRKHAVEMDDLFPNKAQTIEEEIVVRPAIKTLSTRGDLERYFGKPLEDEVYDVVDAAKRDITVLPDLVEDATIAMIDEAMNDPDAILNPNQFLAKMIRKRKHSMLDDQSD